MATVSTRCTHCGQGLTLKKPELVGRKVPCPSCRQPFVVRPITSARPSPADDDDLLEADVIEAEEFGATSGGDDDWLDALDALPPKSPVATPAGEAPRVSKSSRKKKSAAGGKKKRRPLRDADGEFPLWLHRVLMVGSGIVAGVIATLLWAGVIAASGEPSRFMAILVGVFVGTAVRLGASKWDFGWGPALTASVIAFFSIFAGKISGFHMLKGEEEALAEEHNTAYIAMLRHEDYPISQIADEMERELVQATGEFPNQEWLWGADERFVNADGEPNWSEVYNPDYFPERYGTLWEPAQLRWAEMPEAEKDERRQNIAARIEHYESGDREEYAEMYDDLDTNIYGTRIITPWDFFFAIFAIVAAFKIAAGMADDDD